MPLHRAGHVQAAVLALASQWNSAPADFLTPQEQAIADAMLHATRRDSYLLGRYTAKLAVSAWLGGTTLRDIHIEAGVFGQPVVHAPAAGKVCVSISHSGGHAAALAFDEGHPMGVDLEAIDPGRTGLILEQATPGERAVLENAALPLDEAATILWSMKESLSKVLGTGLMCPLALYEIESLDRENGQWTAPFRHFGQYRAIAFDAGITAMRCAICLPRRTEWSISAMPPEAAQADSLRS